MKINREEVSAVFRNCGVSQGDTVFLHSDALVTAELAGIDINQKIDTLFGGITDLLGLEGTLVLPTFTYSATKGEVYNVKQTQSDVGLLTEFFRKRPGVKRSLNPIFSVAAYGSKADVFSHSSANDCFGHDSCFGLIYKYNSWIFTLGCSFDRITFIHYLDQIASVDHRYFKIFPATVINDRETLSFDVSYLVRDIDRKTKAKMDNLKQQLSQNGKIHTSEMGRALLTGVTAKDFYDTALEMIKEHPNAHIEEGYEI
jgi:aminoglycoside 3-N-acetyltransferase